jgi:hypothetical protein
MSYLNAAIPASSGMCDTDFEMVTALQRTATHCNALQHNAKQCKTMQHTATYCNKAGDGVAARGVEKHDSPFQKIEDRQLITALQHNSTHCNTLQHTATHCNKTGVSFAARGV